MRKIRFQGKDFILTDDKEGAITTPEHYSNWECSYAHLFPNGVIKRFHQVIGNIKDIEFGEEIPEEKQLDWASEGMGALLDHPESFRDTAMKERSSR
jgi:hypothetical protein